WSLIYVAFKAIKKLAIPDEPNDFSGVEVLWTGTYWHLWFMPFVLVVTLAAFVIGRRIRGHAVREWSVCAVVSIVGLMLALAQPPAWITSDASFRLLAWNAIPAVCWGLALALVFRCGISQILAKKVSTFIAISAFVVLVTYLAVLGRNNLAENLAG